MSVVSAIELQVGVEKVDIASLPWEIRYVNDGSGGDKKALVYPLVTYTEYRKEVLEPGGRYPTVIGIETTVLEITNDHQLVLDNTIVSVDTVLERLKGVHKRLFIARVCGNPEVEQQLKREYKRERLKELGYLDHLINFMVP